MGIFILGMHRSGTSAITRLVADMGAYLGQESLLLPADSGNPEGYWERKDVLSINRALMKAQNCNWHHIDGFESTRPLPTELKKSIVVCTKELEAQEPFVLKDPRFCLTLPYWLPHLTHNPVIVLAIRHPSAIADSLFRRNQMPLEQGLALWEQYAQQALRHLQGLKVITCDYDKLMQAPDETATELHQKLKKIFPILHTASIASLKLVTQPVQCPIAPGQEKLYDALKSL